MKFRSLMLVLITLAASVAFAANVHPKRGKNAEPAFNDMGLWLAAAGALGHRSLLQYTRCPRRASKGSRLARSRISGHGQF